MEDHYKVEFIEALNLVKIKLFASITQPAMELCFNAFEKRLSAQGLSHGVKLLIDLSSARAVNQYVHSHLNRFYSNQAGLVPCIKMAVVNEHIPGQSEHSDMPLNTQQRHFINEPEALVWLWS